MTSGELPIGSQNSRRRVAIVGNQNNVGFAMMRYFRDLGMDAHLLTFKSDSAGQAGHFHPRNDTWDWSRWSPFVKFTGISDDFTTGVSCPIGWTYWAFLRVGEFLGVCGRPSRPISVRKLRAEFDGFEFVIGSGIAPALFARMGRKLDIFWPYSQGVEHIQGVPRRGPRKWYGRLFLLVAWRVRSNQAKGIREAGKVICGPEPETEKVLSGIRDDLIIKFAPMVYEEEKKPGEPVEFEGGRVMVEAREKSELLLFSATRQFWSLKRNDLFLREFSKIARRKSPGSIGLVLSEYGPDLSRAKELVQELEVEGMVWWLPKTGRREVRFFSQLADIVVGEFSAGATIWGGTGWEALLDGKPLMQGFEWKPGEFEVITGVPEPPMLGVSAWSEIASILDWALNHPAALEDVGVAAGDWSSRYFGRNLAREWKALLHSKQE